MPIEGHINAFLVGNKLKLLAMRSYKTGHLWEVAKIPEIVACQRCGSLKTVKAGKCTSIVREESVRTQSLWLKIHKHRIYCKDCRKTFTESVSGIWPRRRSTQRFRKSVASACGRMSDLPTVSRFYKVSFGKNGLRLFTPHLMKTGKEIHGHRQELKTRRKLLWSRVKLDYFVRVEIDQYLRNHEKLDELYRWKEKIFEFYRIKGYGRARYAFTMLIDQMKSSTHLEVQRLRRTFMRWKEEILRYFENGYTNAFTERMNGTGKLVQRRAFGYKSFRNYRLRTLSACLFKTF